MNTKTNDEIDYPYVCDDCGRGFLTSSAHNAHQRVHNDDEIVEAGDDGVIIADGGLSFADLSAFQRDVLTAACSIANDDQEPNGQQIKARLDAKGYDDIKSGRFYPALDHLADRGLIEKRQDEDDQRNNRYRPTASAEELLEDYAAFVVDPVNGSTENETDGRGLPVKADGGTEVVSTTDAGSECDCPLQGESYQNAMPDPCNAEGPAGEHLCSKPEGHKGPHAACNAVEHPVKVWEKEADRDA